MLLEAGIAWRYLRSKKAHSAVNIIALVSVLAVVVATAALVCVLSVFNGFADIIYSRLSMMNPDLLVSPLEGRTIENSDSVLATVREVSGVECATATIEGQALARFAQNQLPVIVKGVDEEEYTQVNDVRKLIVDGDFLLNDDISNYAVVSVEVAYGLGLRAGYLRMLNLYAPRREGKVSVANAMNAFRCDSLFIGGIYQYDMNEVNMEASRKNMVIVPMQVTRKLFNYPEQCTAIEVCVGEGQSVDAVEAALRARLGANYQVRNRLEQEVESFKVVNMEKWMTFLLLAFILIISTFNVIGALSLLIEEKRQAITTFRSMGATGKQITRIFMAEGWIISMVGALIGIVIGVVLSLIQQHFGIISMQGDASVMIVDAYPVKVMATDVLVVLCLSAVVGWITSLAAMLAVKRN